MRTLNIGTAEVRILPDANQLNQALATEIQQRALAKEGGNFSLALSGGSTPKSVYELMAAGTEFPWTRTDFFFGDERDVPSDHKDSNFRMAREAMFDKAAAPAERIHRVETEHGTAEAALRYEEAVKKIVADREGTPRFDLVLLGMGPDGHTASLFPGTTALGETKRLVIENAVPQLNTNRITFTYPLINAAAEVWFLTAGDGKAEMLRNILHGDPTGVRYPSQDIAPTLGRLVWWVDEAAARLL